MGTGTYPAVQTLTVTFSDYYALDWVFDSRCTTCGAGTLFDKSKSSSYKYAGLSSDRVCLDYAATTCTDRFKFWLVE